MSVATGRAVLLAAALLAVGTARGEAAPVELADPEIRAGLEALAEGRPDRARRILALAAPRRREECRALAVRLDRDAPERVATCLAAARGYLGLGLAFGGRSESDRAYDAFRDALELEPTLFPDRARTPPRVWRVFEAARRAVLPAGRAPGSLEGLEHHPPLVALRGNAVPLDVTRSADAEEPRAVAIVYAVDDLAEGSYRLDARASAPGRFSASIPPAATLEGRPIHYRVEAVDGAGRVRSTRWYPVIVVDALPEAPLEPLSVMVDGPELEAAARISTRTAVGPRAPRPGGVESAGGPRRDGSPGGLVGFVASLMP